MLVSAVCDGHLLGMLWEGATGAPKAANRQGPYTLSNKPDPAVEQPNLTRTAVGATGQAASSASQPKRRTRA
jgi:hypothetical protein